MLALHRDKRTEYILFPIAPEDLCVQLFGGASDLTAEGLVEEGPAWAVMPAVTSNAPTSSER